MRVIDNECSNMARRHRQRVSPRPESVSLRCMRLCPYRVPATLRDFIVLSIVDDGAVFGGSIFRRKYAAEPPDFPQHVVAFYRAGDAFIPVSYLHVNLVEGVGLIGGGATDGSVFAHMAPAERAAISEAGGLLLQTLRFSFARFARDCEAFFGHCGDARAFAVDMQAGFQPTAHENLLVHWHRLLDQTRRDALTAQVHALGPF